MNEITIKEKAKFLFEQRKFSEGFEKLEELGFADFCNYLFKNNDWITKGSISLDFWDNYFPKSALFDKIISGENAVNLLHHYFSKNDTISPKLLERLASDFPEVLIKTIRVNRVFLNETHFQSLSILRNYPNAYLRNHYLFCEFLSIQEKELFRRVENSIQSINNYSVIEILQHTGIWFEEMRASLFLNHKNGVIKYDIHHYTESFNFFLSLYFFHHKEKIKNFAINNDKEYKEFESILAECTILYKKGLLHSHPVWQSIDNVVTYWYYVTGTLNTYCFDFNFELSVSNNELVLKPVSMPKLNEWFAENLKLEYWYNYYRSLAEEMIGQAINKGEITIPDKTGFDYQMNLEGGIRRNVAMAISNDYCFLDSEILGITTEQFIKVLNGFNSNAYGRFVFPIDQLNAERPENWLLHIASVFDSFWAVEISAAPLRVISYDKWSELVKLEVNEDMPETGIKNLMLLLSNNPSEIKSFNRFNPSVNITSRPFLKVNEHYIAFNGIMGESDIMSNVLVNMLDKNNIWRKSIEKDETDKMEKNLALLFKDAGFNNFIFNEKYEGGDFDVLLYDKGNMLLIELKRSKIRVLLDEAWDELQNSLNKASFQLEKGEKYLKENFKEFKAKNTSLNIKENDFSGISFYSIIVSTSFEHDHQLIRGKHLKISFFEIQEILYELKGTKSSLENFIHQIANNEYWRKIEGYAQPKNEESVTIRMKLI